MNTTVMPHLYHSPAEVSHALFLFRCLLLVGFTVLVWDGFLMFTRELKAIRKMDNLAYRCAFIWNRVGVLFSLSPYLIGLFSPRPLTDKICQNLEISASILYVVADSLGNLSAVVTVFLLWNRRPGTLALLLSGAVVAFCCNIVLMVLNSVYGFTEIKWIPDAGIDSCYVVDYSRYIIGIYSVQLCFDVYAAILVLINAMDMPRTVNTQILGALRSQGGWLLLATLVLRLLNLLLAILHWTTFWLLGIIVIEPLISILNARLIAQTCEHEPAERSPSPEGQDIVYMIELTTDIKVDSPRPPYDRYARRSRRVKSDMC
ncbi:hypothetical protein CONPUDRAFT_84433 [Coniophora puteana RWD-64-598 SS2]|uniref:Uncharacterized protein n=1 Tax=Coniophora puteana (strain RWD-64-598) TaxID=741705 RepID=A0A5M3MES7_CONPW|nr:uncharacterized protein CONPUDRAFT_84433 [Coniophora puteana RWD-64-598 SS2]EIW77304.1 hypothetical protein CONPUDRAFT_84433 [Coniophora puteana RWD-64-598 SS2]